jgi:uncharacterized protein
MLSRVCHNMDSMFSLQRMIGGDGKFFFLLEASAEQTTASAKALEEWLKHPSDTRSLEALMQTRRNDKHLTEEINLLLCRTFVTPLDRDDIEYLATALYKIPKTLEKFLERLLICQALAGTADFSRQIQIVVQASNIVRKMVQDVRHNPELDIVKSQNDQLQHLEGEADKVLLELKKELYSGRYDPVQVLAVDHLYELLEKAIDRCRDAGIVLFRMALKLW